MKFDKFMINEAYGPKNFKDFSSASRKILNEFELFLEAPEEKLLIKLLDSVFEDGLAAAMKIYKGIK